MPSTIEVTDQELLTLLKKGDKQAFTEIYARYAESLTGFAAAKLSNLDDARDLLHDLFVSIWENRATINITSNLRSYLFSAIRFKIIDRIRRNITREEYTALLTTFADTYTDGFEKQLEAKELQELVNSSLEQISPKTKEIYLLSRDNHHSVAEIAQLLGLSEQTVKNQLTMALHHLRKAISGLALLVLLMEWLDK